MLCVLRISCLWNRVVCNPDRKMGNQFWRNVHFSDLPQGTYYLFYSGNNFDTAQYAISYATASAVGGPYTKHGPWLASSTVFGSVSHCAALLTQGPRGVQLLLERRNSHSAGVV